MYIRRASISYKISATTTLVTAIPYAADCTNFGSRVELRRIFINSIRNRK